MENKTLISKAAQFTEESPLNYVSKDDAIREELVGLKMFEAPLLGFGAADDAMFTELKKKEAVGPQFMLPNQWLDGAKTVVSFFVPFSEQVKKSNYSDDGFASAEWVHARIEGQKFIVALSKYLQETLEAEGYRAVVPSCDERFHSVSAWKEGQEGVWKDVSFASNWSERHVAFVCGLGTFGLSKGLITEKGMAGRIGSVVTDAPFEITERLYTEIYEYCIQCGLCIKRCPVHAITAEKGKDHTVCAPYVSKAAAPFAPRYGCGKCQTNVPCESRNPKVR